mmetsp:Transcript_30540/g.65995  ORF Transcript_30540/g.65995 Transcript_30540/m.65995 type:complete len:142 (-) Transcript_30540:364-789(-)
MEREVCVCMYVWMAGGGFCCFFANGGVGCVFNNATIYMRRWNVCVCVYNIVACIRAYRTPNIQSHIMQHHFWMGGEQQKKENDDDNNNNKKRTTTKLPYRPPPSHLGHPRPNSCETSPETDGHCIFGIRCRFPPPDILRPD